MIELNNVSKSYNKGKIKAVHDLNLSIKPGEIFGFLGPNGAGKTTTIKIIMGFLKPDKGEIIINGMNNNEKLLDCKKIISYIPEDPMIYERLKGKEYLKFIGDVYGVSDEQGSAVLNKWLGIFGLADAINDPIKSYSHGMRQKIVLLGALLPQSNVFILDEPMTGLDPKSAHHLKEIMKKRLNH